MNIITPAWPIPNWIKAFTTTRDAGFSRSPYHKGNMAHHVGDDIVTVTLNRLRLNQTFHLPTHTTWLNQTHSDTVVELSKNSPSYLDADGVWTRLPNIPCIIMTADCLPILITDTAGSLVGAIHGGWMGLAKGILFRAIEQISPYAQGQLQVWFGPALGPNTFEAGRDIYDLFVNQDFAYQSAFAPLPKPGKWMADIYALARLQLYQMGISHIYGGDLCTYSDANRFFSYRRDKKTGRMASVIMRTL